MDPVTLAEILLEPLVDNPEAITVQRTDDPDAVRLGATVEPGDVGKVIGRQGRTINAIRQVLRAGSAKLDRPVYFDLLNE